MKKNKVNVIKPEFTKDGVLICPKEWEEGWRDSIEESKETNLSDEELKIFFDSSFSKITGLKLLMSDYFIDNNSIDYIAYDDDNNTFVIIEFLRDKDKSIVAQGHTYISMILNNKDGAAFLYNEKKSEKKDEKDFDWSKLRIIFVSTKFTNEQIGEAEIDTSIVLYQISKYENGPWFINEY